MLLSSALPITPDDPRAGSFRPFPKRNKLVMHVRTHTGERPFRCEECGRGFARADGLASHRRRHEKHAVTGAAARRSNPSVFSNGGNSNGGHDRRPRGSRDEQQRTTDIPVSIFATPELDDPFSSSMVNIVGGVGVWACRVCSRRFSEYANLCTHETDAHPEVTLNDTEHALTDASNLIPLQALVEDAVNAFNFKSSPSSSTAFSCAAAGVMYHSSLPANPTPPPAGWDVASPTDLMQLDSATQIDATFWAMMAEQQFQGMLRGEDVPTSGGNITLSSHDEFLTPASHFITDSMADWA